jgi:hypothetical protein
MTDTTISKADNGPAYSSEPDIQVDELKINYAWLKGCAAAAVILIPLCAIVVWWLIGDRLNDIKAQVLQARPPPPTMSTP